VDRENDREVTVWGGGQTTRFQEKSKEFTNTRRGRRGLKRKADEGIKRYSRESEESLRVWGRRKGNWEKEKSRGDT